MAADDDQTLGRASGGRRWPVKIDIALFGMLLGTPASQPPIVPAPTFLPPARRGGYPSGRAVVAGLVVGCEVRRREGTLVDLFAPIPLKQGPAVLSKQQRPTVLPSPATRENPCCARVPA